MFIDYPLVGLMPAQTHPAPWKTKTYSLPVGGLVGLPGGFPQGQALTLIGGAAQSEVRTLTITANGATGFTGYFTYVGSAKVYPGLLALGGTTANAVTALPTAAQIQAALVAAVPEWAGSVTVTGASPTYTITFTALMANRMVGGILSFVIAGTTGGPPTAAITTAQQGSAGAAQANIYVPGVSPNVCGFLKYPALPEAGGSEGTEFGNTGQITDGFTAYTMGFFYVAQPTVAGQQPGVVGLDATAMGFKNLQFEAGQSLTDVGAVIQIT